MTGDVEFHFFSNVATSDLIDPLKPQFKHERSHPEKGHSLEFILENYADFMVRLEDSNGRSTTEGFSTDTLLILDFKEESEAILELDLSHAPRSGLIPGEYVSTCSWQQFTAYDMKPYIHFRDDGLELILISCEDARMKL